MQKPPLCAVAFCDRTRMRRSTATPCEINSDTMRATIAAPELLPRKSSTRQALALRRPACLQLLRGSQRPSPLRMADPGSELHDAGCRCFGRRTRGTSTDDGSRARHDSAALGRQRAVPSRHRPAMHRPASPSQRQCQLRRAVGSLAPPQQMRGSLLRDVELRQAVPICAARPLNSLYSCTCVCAQTSLLNRRLWKKAR
jgi:hypothetical protein